MYRFIYFSKITNKLSARIIVATDLETAMKSFKNAYNEANYTVEQVQELSEYGDTTVVWNRDGFAN